MGTQPESKLSRRIQDAIRAEGWFCFKVHGSEFTMAGLPDIIVCARGLFVGVETKVPGKEKNTSARQDYVHNKIRQAEGVAVVVTSPAQAIQAIKKALTDHGMIA